MKIRGSRHLQRKLALIISMATCTAIFFILFLTYYTRTTKEIDNQAPQTALKEEENDLFSQSSEQESLIKALQVKSENQSKEIEGLLEQLHYAQNKLSQSEKKLSAYYEDNLQKKLRELNSSLDGKNQLIEEMTFSQQTLQDELNETKTLLKNLEKDFSILSNISDIDLSNLQKNFLKTQRNLEQSIQVQKDKIKENQNLQDELVLAKQRFKKELQEKVSFIEKLETQVENNKVQNKKITSDNQLANEELKQNIKQLQSVLEQQEYKLEKEKENRQSLTEQIKTHKALTDDKSKMIHVMTEDNKALRQELLSRKEALVAMQESFKNLQAEKHVDYEKTPLFKEQTQRLAELEKALKQENEKLQAREKQFSQILAKDEDDAKTLSTFLERIQLLESEVSELESEKHALTFKVQTQEKRLESTNKDLLVFQEQVHSKNSQILALETENTDLKKAVENFQTDLKQNTLHIAESEEVLSSMQKNFQKELNETRNTLHEREKQLATLDGKLSSITKESERLNKLLEKKEEEFLERFSSKQSDSVKHEYAYKEALDSIQRYKQQLSELSEEHQALILLDQEQKQAVVIKNNQILALEKDLKEVNNELEQLKESYLESEKESETYLAQIENFERNETSLLDLQKEVHSKEIAISELKQELHTALEYSKKTENELFSVQNELNIENQELRKSNSTIQKKLQKLEYELAQNQEDSKSVYSELTSVKEHHALSQNKLQEERLLAKSLENQVHFLEQQIKTSQNQVSDYNLTQRNLQEKTLYATKLESEIKLLSQQLSMHKQQLSSNEQNLRTLQEKAIYTTEVENKLELLQEDLSKKEAILSHSDETINTLQTALKNLEKIKSKQDEKLSYQENQLNLLNKEILKKELSLDSLKETLSKNRIAVEEGKENKQKSQLHIDSLQKDLALLEGKYSQKNIQVRALDQELNALKVSSQTQFTNLQNQNFELKQALAESKNKEKLLEQNIAVTSTLKKELENLSSHYKQELSESEENKHALLSQNARLQSELLKVKSQLTSHEDKVEQTQLLEEQFKNLQENYQLLKREKQNLESQQVHLAQNEYSQNQYTQLLAENNRLKQQLYDGEEVYQTNPSKNRALSERKEELNTRLKALKKEYKSWKPDTRSTEKELAYTEIKKKSYDSKKSGVTQIHLVSENETLEDIAMRYYGEYNSWIDIYEANRAVIPNKNHLKRGTALIIP